jgi:hypothetical protein
MLLEARETRELVAHFDDTVFVGLEEESHVTIVDYRDVFVFRGFTGRELNMSIHPCLEILVLALKHPV